MAWCDVEATVADADMRKSIVITLTWARSAVALLILFALLIGGALLVAWSGVYSIAASRGHQPFVQSFLELGMKRSVRVNAQAPARPNVEIGQLVALGAAHYRAACATCHGAPDQPVDPTAQAMLPVPPFLAPLVERWEDNELHWIVTHGLQYTGMPGWPGEDRPDEVWAMVAFLRALPQLTASEYRALSQRGRETSSGVVGVSPETLDRCAACHGLHGSAPASPLIPNLAGQSAGYLARSLREYREGARESGFMEPVASRLTDRDIESLAAYYSALSPAPRPDADSAPSQTGLALAMEGAPARNVAACQACHSGAARSDYPTLAGQPQVYLQTQLELWRRGGRAETDHGRTMAAIARQLTVKQMEDVTVYYSSLPPAPMPAPQIGAPP